MEVPGYLGETGFGASWCHLPVLGWAQEWIEKEHGGCRGGQLFHPARLGRKGVRGSQREPVFLWHHVQ